MTEPLTALRPGPTPTRRVDGVRRALRWLLARPGLALSIVAVLVVIGWTLAPGAAAAQDPLTGVAAQRLQPPSPQHWFGTDNLGRDVFARVVHGARNSLAAVALAIAISFVGAAAVGLLSGFVGGALDSSLMRVVDVMLSVPGLLIALMLITALGAGTTNVAIAVGIGSIAALSRVMRAEVLRVRQSVYVEASRGAGSRWWTTVLRHVLPNSIGPIVVLSTLEFGGVILAISGLSFLGFGASPPTPEWGSMVADGRSYLVSAPWMTAAPALVIVVLVLATNRIARALDGERRR
ncbi:MAG: ABC transporter permease [Microbacterium sp.]